jgi:acetyl-CoA carboxylase, biotin carboxylase subunit
MICKIISFGEDRQEAIDKLIYGLSKTIYLGSITNKNFIVSILKNKLFQKGEFNTHFISKYYQNVEFKEYNDKVLESVSFIPMLNDWWNNKNNKVLW